MNDPLVLSFDLDDTLWPVQPVMLAAEAAMLAWLQEQHPLVMQGQDRESLRAMRVRIATQFPDRGHDKVHRRSLYTFWKRTSPPRRVFAIA